MRTIVSLFKEQVNKNPSNIAVISSNLEMSYKDLDFVSDKCANVIQTLTSKGDRIGICFSEDPVNIIVGILAILKIGCSYIPLDPKNPDERIEYLLNSSKPKIILGDEKTPKSVTSYSKFILISDLKNNNNNSYKNVEINGEDIAYIIFTSGSTGLPKGVAVTHENLIKAYLAWDVVYKLKEIKCHLQVAGYSFDVFSGDWIRSLCSGAKLIMCPEKIIQHPEEVFRLIELNRVECAEFLPALLRDLFHYLSDTKQKLTTLKVLICGSDKWFVSEYFYFKSYLANNVRLINSYGTSETTIDTSYFEFTEKNILIKDETIQVPIGKAFPGMEIILLDENLIEVKTGNIGELFIGGSGVSHGYINAPTLNSEKFIIINNKNYFRTGDYGRELSTGDIEFIGRRDNQVKFRGKRISLAEIENVLITHFPISDSAVLLFENNNKAELISFIVPRRKEKKNLQNNIRELITKYLPSYMLPDKYFFISKLPTNLSGKIDKKVLLNKLINKDYE